MRFEDVPGLNLTRATLDGILKYPWLRHAAGQQSEYWGVYVTEKDEFDWARHDHAPGETARSIEAQLMDWADDIAYAVHDVEDFYQAGLIPVDRLIKDGAELKRFLDGAFRRLKETDNARQNRLEDAFQEVVYGFSLDEPFNGSIRHRAALKSTTSSLIRTYVLETHLADSITDRNQLLKVDDLRRMQVDMLKQLTWHYVIDRPELAAQQFGQRRIIKGLFDIYSEEALGSTANRDRLGIFPANYREELDRETSEEGKVRYVVDLIASMTEQQAAALFHRLTGISLSNPFHAV